MNGIPARRAWRFKWVVLLLGAGCLMAAQAFSQQAAVKAQEKAAAKDEAKAKTAQGKARAAAKAKAALPEPTFANVPYGTHERQVIDFYQAKSATPTPLVVFIHGGGWNTGDKSRIGSLDLPRLLENGISVAAVNYRLVPQAQEAGIKPPVKWPLEDAARAIQFLRSRASEWNIDPTRIGANGGSAGACSSLWLALHDDMANPDSDDPIARQSTRLSCAAVAGAQTAFDPIEVRQWMPNISYGGHAFGFVREGEPRDAAYQDFYDHRDEVLPWIIEYSPISHASAGDPPLFLEYASQDKPPVVGEEQKDPTHSAVFGLKLQEKLHEHGCDAILAYPGHLDPTYKNCTDFLIERLSQNTP